MLEESRIVRLDSIGFVRSVLGDNWERMFQTLVQYRQEHGDCNVPKDWPHDRQLARWVIKQRSHRKQNDFSAERIRQLEEIGFMWETRDTKWNEMFTALVQYKELHSTCNVPAEYEENPHLARWVKKQRQRRNSRTLDDERTRRLTKIGFAWDVHGAKWDEMFNTLVAYKERNGDCCVPRNYAKNPQLARWVGKQRSKRKTQSQSQLVRLNSIGFEWKMKGSTSL